LSIKVRAIDIILLLPGLVALILCISGEYFPVLMGLILGVLMTYLLMMLRTDKILTYILITWLILALIAALLSSSYLAMISVSYLLASLGYIALTVKLSAGRASLIFFTAYLIPESVLELIKLGLPTYKYLPYLIKLGAADWDAPDLPVRIAYMVSAGYLIITYLLRNVKAYTMAISMLMLSGIYALITIILTSASGIPNAYYVAAITGLLPLAILTAMLRSRKL